MTCAWRSTPWRQPTPHRLPHVTDVARAAHTARELRWLLLSPPLLDTTSGAHPAAIQQFTLSERQAIAQWLCEVDRDPEPLWCFVHPGVPAGVDAARWRAPSPRLGRRAERLMEYFLRHGPAHRLLAANVALREVSPQGLRTTTGEIDFLLQDDQGQRWQWELAVKFYLCTARGAQATPADFIGPDRVDTLGTKLNKMFGRQLRHTPPAPWDAEPWTPAACTRGRLFYRWGDSMPATPGVAADHLRGNWIERDRLGELTDADQSIWQVVPRSDWMAPPLPLDVAPPRTLHDIACQIDSQAEARSASGPPTATLVMRLAAEDGAGSPEALPLFIVSAT
jgi:hypothetical protein